jgi:hypothetical protein
VSPLDAALLVMILALPLFWLVLRELDRLDDPAYLRRQGVVIVLDRVLEARSAPIGEYMGRPIWATVTFMGVQYRFDHVIERRRRDRIEPRQLFLEPGLVYITD